MVLPQVHLIRRRLKICDCCKETFCCDFSNKYQWNFRVGLSRQNPEITCTWRHAYNPYWLKSYSNNKNLNPKVVRCFSDGYKHSTRYSIFCIPESNFARYHFKYYQQSNGFAMICSIVTSHLTLSFLLLVVLVW